MFQTNINFHTSVCSKKSVIATVLGYFFYAIWKLQVNEKC